MTDETLSWPVRRPRMRGNVHVSASAQALAPLAVVVEKDELDRPPSGLSSRGSTLRHDC